MLFGSTTCHVSWILHFSETHCFIGNVGIICVLVCFLHTFQAFISFLPFPDVFCAADTHLSVCFPPGLPCQGVRVGTDQRELLAGWKLRPVFLTLSLPLHQASGSSSVFVSSWPGLLPSGPSSWLLFSLGSSNVFSLCLSTWRNQVKVFPCCKLLSVSHSLFS